MATITKMIQVYFRPSNAGTAWEYTYLPPGNHEDDDYIFICDLEISFENNIDTRTAQIDLIDKAIQKIDAEHYAKKTALEARRNELLAIGNDGGEG